MRHSATFRGPEGPGLRAKMIGQCASFRCAALQGHPVAKAQINMSQISKPASSMADAPRWYVRAAHIASNGAPGRSTRCTAVHTSLDGKRSHSARSISCGGSHIAASTDSGSRPASTSTASPSTRRTRSFSAGGAGGEGLGAMTAPSPNYTLATSNCRRFWIWVAVPAGIPSARVPATSVPRRSVAPTPAAGHATSALPGRSRSTTPRRRPRPSSLAKRSHPGQMPGNKRQALLTACHHPRTAPPQRHPNRVLNAPVCGSEQLARVSPSQRSQSAIQRPLNVHIPDARREGSGNTHDAALIAPKQPGNGTVERHSDLVRDAPVCGCQHLACDVYRGSCDRTVRSGLDGHKPDIRRASLRHC
jgi:hypothetical protein